jgi:hypothetical protein
MRDRAFTTVSSMELSFCGIGGCREGVLEPLQGVLDKSNEDLLEIKSVWAVLHEKLIYN